MKGIVLNDIYLCSGVEMIFFYEVDYTKELCVVDDAMTHYLHKREKSFLQLLLCSMLGFKCCLT